VKFIDNYWLAFVLAPYKPGPPPKLVLLNTEQTTTADAKPAQTTFDLNPLDYTGYGMAFLHLEPGGYEPSSGEDSFAPFYPDASQRVLAVDLCGTGMIYVVKTEVLLKLAREWGPADIEWKRWKAHAFEVWTGDVVARWVSGHRFFCVYPSGSGDEAACIEVYDFGARASAGEMETTTGGGRKALPSVRGHPLWDVSMIQSGEGNRDTMAFLMVNALRSPDLTPC